jgi:type I restriction enzyme M protein
MAKTRDIPHDLRQFHSVFQKLAYYKYDPAEVLDTFLEWVAWGFCSDNSLTWESGKRFDESERTIFFELYKEWALLMKAKITHEKAWFDVFGTYYEIHVAGNSRRSSKGQFFTPEPICDFMVLAQGGGIGQNVSDPACGSGRFLLSYHAHNPGNFLYAEDIDKTCCLMTICNFLIHGAVGEVVHHNSLDPNSWFNGWVVNENLNNPTHKHFGIPHVRKLNREDSHIMNYWKQRAEEVAKQRMMLDIPEAVIVQQNSQKQQYQQLQIF